MTLISPILMMETTHPVGTTDHLIPQVVMDQEVPQEGEEEMEEILEVDADFNHDR